MTLSVQEARTKIGTLAEKQQREQVVSSKKEIKIVTPSGESHTFEVDHSVQINLDGNRLTLSTTVHNPRASSSASSYMEINIVPFFSTAIATMWTRDIHYNRFDEVVGEDEFVPNLELKEPKDA